MAGSRRAMEKNGARSSSRLSQRRIRDSSAPVSGGDRARWAKTDSATPGAPSGRPATSTTAASVPDTGKALRTRSAVTS